MSICALRRELCVCHMGAQPDFFELLDKIITKTSIKFRFSHGGSTRIRNVCNYQSQHFFQCIGFRNYCYYTEIVHS